MKIKREEAGIEEEPLAEWEQALLDWRTEAPEEPGSSGYPVETVDAFEHHTWKMTESIYVQHVMEMVDRDEVLSRYVGEGVKPFVTDAFLTALAIEDFHNGPDEWLFSLEDFGYETA